jgi:hypothetical protein
MLPRSRDAPADEQPPAVHAAVEQPTAVHHVDRQPTTRHPNTPRRYPVSIDIDYEPQRNRITTLMRLPLAIPLITLALAYSMIATAVSIVAWLPLLITGSWPLGLYELNAAILRYTVRANAYILLATDRYPPLSLRRTAKHPVHVTVDAPLRRYSRLKILLRALYVIPAYIAGYLLLYLANVTWIASWVTIVATGRQQAPLQRVTVLCLRYTTSVYALTYLVSESYPPLRRPNGNDGRDEAGGARP